ncbi:hypothetical protein FKM82_002095 [Ascaphus truei]
MTRAGDVCLSSAGAQVTLATSSDERHPPEHIIDGNPETFWTTTGMFPQEFIISLRGLLKISKITLQSTWSKAELRQAATLPRVREPLSAGRCVLIPSRQNDAIGGGTTPAI